jgi:hypothetical protein
MVVGNNNICYSGGAEGADKLFGELAEEAGHGVIHYSFAGHKTPCTKNVVILPPVLLYNADKALKKVAPYIGRKFPTASEYVSNLLRRNYSQIANGSERIYAVSYLGPCGFVGGGTGWTVMLGVLHGIKEIYVYDTNLRSWYQFLAFHQFTEFNNDELKWEKLGDDINKVPFPHGKYTGIGSHDLPAIGRLEIEKLYKKRGE